MCVVTNISLSLPPSFFLSLFLSPSPPSLYLSRYGLSWNPSQKGYLLSASDDHVSTIIQSSSSLILVLTHDCLPIWDVSGHTKVSTHSLSLCLLLTHISLPLSLSLINLSSLSFSLLPLSLSLQEQKSLDAKTIYTGHTAVVEVTVHVTVT